MSDQGRSSEKSWREERIAETGIGHGFNKKRNSRCEWDFSKKETHFLNTNAAEEERKVKDAHFQLKQANMTIMELNDEVE